jgi:pimeloyl-ACP methyl ester carboxylesterase
MRESVHTFGRAVRLVGISTEAVAPRRRAAAVLVNSGSVHRIGANRISVVLARRLAGEGFDSLRFDMSGLGDSSAREDGLSWERSSPLEIREAVDLVCERDPDRPVLLYGNCGGAAKSLWAAAGDERVDGVILTNPPPHPAEAESGEEAAEEAAEEVAAGLDELLRRGLRAGFVYAEGDVGQDYFERRLSGRLEPHLTERRLELFRIPSANHTFSPAPAQRAALDGIVSWLLAWFAAPEVT